MGTMHFELGLQARGISEVADAAGVEIACRCGSIWITLDGDPRDIVLDAGQRFQTDQSRRALIYALEPSRLVLSHCETPRFAAASVDLRPRWPAVTPVMA